MKIMSVDTAQMLVHGYGSVELDPAKMADDLSQSAEYLQSRLYELLNDNIVGKLTSNRAILGIPTARTFSRTFSLPADKKANLKDAVNLEVEQYIPMPLDALYVDHQIIKQTKEELTVLMCAAPKRTVDPLLTIAQQCGMEVAMIEPNMNAVARLLEHTEEGNLPTVIVDIGPATAEIAILDSAIRVTGGLNIGGNTFTLDIAKKMNIPLETAHQLKVLNGLSAGPRQAKITASLRPSLLRIAGEIKNPKSLDLLTGSYTISTQNAFVGISHNTF